jgi:protocatechuate 3,4-dioxygenase, beta subunit
MNRRWLYLLLPAAFAIALVAFASNTTTKSSVATLAPDGEPGTRLVVAGRVFDETGTRGVAGVKLFAYHTDAKGLYNDRRDDSHRLNGTVVTDAEGRFEWRTIRPMPYPGGGNPAHFHIQASGGGYPEQWVEELQFSDDPYLTAAQRSASAAKGKFASIVTTTRDGSGVLHATYNIRLSKNPRR